VLALLIQVQLETKEAGRCERWLDKLAAIDPTPLRLLALQVHVAVQLDKQADVVAQIEPKAASLIQTAKSDEDKLRLYRGIGDLYASLKQHAAAEHWYRVLVAADARQYPVVVAALTQQGRVKEAIDLCEQASKTNETTEPAIMVSNALVQGSATPEDFQRAELILAAALERFPADLRLLYSVALVRVIQGNVPQSIELFRKIVEANPRFVPALNNLAMTLGEIPADRPEALRLIDQALEIAGRNASLLDTKAAILLYSGRSKEAVPLLESATRDVEADPRHHFHLALAYRDQGKTAEAKVHLQTALDRKLVSQVLTATDQKMLSDLRADLQP
jgi:tetratricopeptide (TPR) repeat protein